MTRRLRFVAGEASGDMLGSLLIQSLKAQSIQTQSLQGQQAIDCAGIAGPKMEAAGCTAWWPSERLSVSGFNWQVAQRIPELFKIRRALCEYRSDRYRKKEHRIAHHLDQRHVDQPLLQLMEHPLKALHTLLLLSLWLLRTLPRERLGTLDQAIRHLM